MSKSKSQSTAKAEPKSKAKAESTCEATCETTPERPHDRGSLRRWVAEHLELKLVDRAVCPGHQSPLDYLEHAFFERGKDVVVWAPRGGGKTTLGAAATLLDLIYKPQCQVRILGGSLEQSLRMWESLWPWWKKFHEQVQSRRSKEKVVIMKNEASVGVLTQSERSVRGVRVQKLRCDEVELFNPDIWEAAQLVTRSIGKGDETVHGVVEAFSTLHRPHGMMRRVIESARETGRPVIRWCMLEVLAKCEADRECEHCPLQADCDGAAKRSSGGHLRIDDAIAMKHRVSRETWEAEMLCKRPSTRNCVFPNFSEEAHVREEVSIRPEYSRLWLGVDFGFQNPFVCLWIRADDTGRVHVVDEYIQNHRQLQQHIVELRARRHGDVYALACDPAGKHRSDQTARSNVRLLREAGFSVRTHGSRILEGIEQIRAGLAPAAGEATLFIHPRCRRLIEALSGYRYEDDVDEVPLKDGRHDHLVDALRYFYICSKKASAAMATAY